MIGVEQAPMPEAMGIIGGQPGSKRLSQSSAFCGTGVEAAYGRVPETPAGDGGAMD